MDYEKYVEMMNENMDNFKNNLEKIGLNFYPVQRQEVEKMDFSGIKEVIKILEKKKKKANGSLVITFSGYDESSDEVFEIPEVRKWVEQVFEFCPHFAYFISFEMECHKWVIPCICNEVNTMMAEGDRKSEADWFREGKFSVDMRPKMSIKMKMEDDKLQHLVSGLKMYGMKINDQVTTAKIIKYLKFHFEK